MKNLIKKLNKLLFITAIIALGITFFARNNYRAVEELNPKGF